MNVSLTDEMKDFVQNKVASGDFPSEEAVLQEAVRRFRHEDQLGVMPTPPRNPHRRTSPITRRSSIAPRSGRQGRALD